MSDTTPPAVHAVRLRQGYLEIEFDEEPDLASVQTAITVTSLGPASTITPSSTGLSSASAALGPTEVVLIWALLQDGFTVRADQPLGAGSYDLQIDGTLQDLAGIPLPSLFQQQFEATVAAADLELFEEPEGLEIQTSSVGNVFGFQGHPMDPETGLIYIRNRYYDPEIGRFITVDPLGYVDGPSMYQFGRYSPVNFGDPMGLEAGWMIAREHEQLEEAGIDPYRYGKGEVPQEVLLAVQTLRTAWIALGGYDFFGTLCFPLCPPTEEMGEQWEEDAHRYLTMAPGSFWYEKFPEAEAFYEATEPVRSPETLLPTQAQVVITPLKPLAQEAFGATLMVTPLGMVKGPRALRVKGPRVPKRIPQLKAFEKLGIETTEHFRRRLAKRVTRGINERKALDVYKNGRLFYNEETNRYIRHSSRTGVSVVTDAPTRGRAISVFEGKPSPDWVPVRWRPGI